jgi:6-phosphogluconolactonase
MTDESKTLEPDEQAEATEPAAPEAPAAAPPPWVPSPAQVHRYPDADSVAAAAVKRFIDSAKRAVHRSGRFIVVLAGGSTPRALYRLLTESPQREAVAWDKTLFVFGDERCVPPDDEASNYRMARETLLDPLEIPGHRVLRIKGEQKPLEAARRYQVRLGDLFLGDKKRHFDLALLGIGADGHTASLFPGTAALDETERWVVANEVPQLDTWRLTLTLPALCQSRKVLFLATGEEKAPVIAEAFGGVEHPAPHPCERVLPRGGSREVLLDRAAASAIPHEDPAET